MATQALRRGEEFWRAALNRHSASGLTLRAFADREGISVNTLAYWKYTRQRRLRSTPLSLVPVRVVEDVPAPPRGIVIELAGGRVLVPADFDAEHLARVLDVLRRSC
jgi:hypothetical protein